MTVEETHTEVAKKNRKNLIVLLIAGVFGALIIALGIMFMLFNPGVFTPGASAQIEELPKKSLIKPVPPSPATEQGKFEISDADGIVEHILASPLEAVEDSNDLETLLGNVAAGDYLAELETQWQEIVANGWSIEGSPKVVSTEVGEVVDNNVEVIACVDSSEVRTIDANGKPIGQNTVSPARHIFMLGQGSDDTWRITSHSFPNDPAC